jgi:glycosyltransferase involved in cell wall biosynthesis
LSHEKGPDLFLEAFARCRDHRLHASIIGDGRERAELEALARALGINERVRFCGQLDDAARYFAAFDVFVMSSRTEGAPIVLFEAMAAEVPVVATSVGGIPEIIARGEAALVPPGDTDALARAIDEVVSSPEQARERSRAALETLRSDYSADGWLANYESLYARLHLQKQETRVTNH